MSWATYDTSNWPVVKVRLEKEILDGEDFEDFKRGWLDLYNRGEEFILIFDTSDVGWVNPKYAYKMASFIEELKLTEVKNGKQLLRESIIFYKSWYVKFLLKLIFTLQSPVAPVHIYPQKIQQKVTANLLQPSI